MDDRLSLPWSQLEFVRQDEDMQGATFRDPASGREYSLNNLAIQQHSLVDKMREAMNDAIQGQGPPVVATHDHAAEPPPAQPSPSAPQLLGGYTEDWRWQVVQDGESTLMAIDNKPSIQRHTDPTKPAPEFQRVVVPVELLQVILRGS